VTSSLEDAFAEAGRSAAAAVKAATLLAGAAKQLQKAAQEGDIAKMRKSAERLASASDVARQSAANAKTAWPYSQSEEQEYLAAGYELELLDEAARAGLKIYPRDSRLLAYPSILRIVPTDLSIKIDKKKISALRPTHLVQALVANQKRKSRYPAERFIQALHNAYLIIVPSGETGSVLKLAQIYQALTLQPGAAAEYNKSDFARDLYMVDESGVSRTRSGARFSLHASTGARGGASDLFTFVAPNGELKTYYGIRFTEG